MAYGVQRGGDAIITITADAAISSAVDLWGLQLVGIDMPATWTAADLAFKVAQSGDANSGDNTYRDLYANGALVVIPVAAGGRYVFDADTIAKFQGVRHVKFVSWNGGTGAVTNQGADRTLVPIVAQTVNL